MKSYKGIVACSVLLLAAAVNAGITISNVTARQIDPWQIAEIKYEVGGSFDVGYNYSTVIDVIDRDASTTNRLTKFLRCDAITVGDNSVVWTPKDETFTVDSTNAVFAVSCLAEPTRYTVKFNANGGSGTMANESFTYGVSQALTANVFKRTDYIFNGWATSANGAKVYSDRQAVSNLTSNGGTVNLYAVWKPALYAVIELSGGSNATTYPISYLDAVPSGGWTDVYKTTKLVLRRIEKGSYKMQGSTTVTLTKPFYMGVFEVTQRQYELVTGSKPSNWSGNTLPVENVSYNMIRGSSNGAKWPSSSAVDSSSFLGKLRARTGLDFDLPTEAQWEYACRAGTTTTYYWGNSMDDNYAWYTYNSSSKSHPVGTKLPNAWGLYDMSGNVCEWCLDWYGTLAYGTDPKGVSSGSYRVVRGGGVHYSANDCASSYRNDYAPSSGADSRGFRLSRTLP